MMSGHPSTLPGDPSLNLVTNVDLGDKKLDIMKGRLGTNYVRNFDFTWILLLTCPRSPVLLSACSKAICDATGKPEAYIGEYCQLIEH